MDNFGYLNSSYYLTLCCNKSAKKIYGVRTFTAEPPPSPIQVSTFLAEPYLSPFERTYFMDTLQNIYILRSEQEYNIMHLLFSCKGEISIGMSIAKFVFCFAQFYWYCS